MEPCQRDRMAMPGGRLAREMSPGHSAGSPKCWATNVALVPLPAPGGPISTSLTAGTAPSSQESFVVALLELALDLLHGVQRDADHDEDRRSAEREVLVGGDEDQ